MKKATVAAFIISLIMLIWTVPALAADKLDVSIGGTAEVESGISSTLTANVSGGVQPYTYAWNTEEDTASIIVLPTKDTQYSVTVTDVSGNSASASFKVRLRNSLSVTIDGSGVVDEGGSVTLTAVAEDGIAPYTYEWNTVPKQSKSSIDVSPTVATNYMVTVTDAMGASASAHMMVKVSSKGEPVPEASYSISVNEKELDFGTVGTDGEAYEPAKLRQKITLKNAGDSEVTLKIPGSAYYSFSGIYGETKLQAGNSLDIEICPKADLDQGNYDERIVFRTEQGTKAPLDAYFTVSSPDVSANEAPVFANESILKTTEYAYGRGSITLEIDNKNKKAGIGIRQTSDFVNAVLSEDERNAAADGGAVTVKITSDLLEGSDIPEKGKQLVEGAVVNFRTDIPGIQPGLYMGLSIKKNLNGGSWYKVNKLKKDVALQFTLPHSFTSKGSQFVLMRANDGICKQVAVWDENDTEYVFNTSQFGLFNAAYVPLNSSVSSDGTVADTSGRQRMILLFITSAVLLVLAVLLIIRRVNRVTRADRADRVKRAKREKHGRRTGRNIHEEKDDN